MSRSIRSLMLRKHYKIRACSMKRPEPIVCGMAFSNTATLRRPSETRLTWLTSTAFIFIASRAHLLRTTSSSPRGILKMNVSITPATIRSPHSRFKNARIDFSQAVTNKCPVGPNRGYSRMQHLWFLERVVDICAHELRIPPDEMRLRNYIRTEEFPYTTPNGCVYDSGNYPKMLEIAKRLIGWDDWKKKQAEARKEGRLIGIGIGTTLDSGTNNFGQSQIVNPALPYSGNSQGSNCKLDIYGEVVVAVGSCPQGQGHETTAAQVVADVLNIHPDLVTVRTGFDTERNVHTGFSGTYASQFAVSGLSAVHGAAQKLKAEMTRLAAFALDVNEDDLEFGAGAQGPEIRAKNNGKSISYWGLANLVNANSAALPTELYELTLNCRYIWRAPIKVTDK